MKISHGISRLLTNILLFGFLGLALFITMGPIYWVVISSFKSTREIITPPPTLFPAEFVLTHYERLLSQPFFLQQLGNSVYVSLISTALTLAIVLCAAFGAYRGHLPILRNLKFVAIIAFVFPMTLLVVPIYEMLVRLNLVDTLWSVILVNCVLTVPFSFWLIEGFFDAVPIELEEAALVDGANRWQIASHVLMPLILPGIATIGIFSFVISWTEYTFSSVLIIDPHLRTLPLGLAAILAQYNVDWGLLTTYTTLAMIPGVVFFAIAGRYFISGLVTGALKA